METDVAVTLPILFTISGGISLGSYQSGVNWALVRFIRGVHENAAYRKEHRLPQLRFAAMAGASAGNINALMSAVAWFSEQPGEAPESSIFWQTWVHTGWEELLPRQRGQYGGVFDRTYFADGPLTWLAAAKRRVSYPAEFDIPLGMTMTRVHPTKTALADNITASTQRYAALLRVGLSSDKTRIVFTQPDTSLFDRSLGALASLGIRAGDELPDSQVLNGLMASSAYPVAFADVTLSYIHGDTIAMDAACAATARSADVCGHWTTASFIDGGLFDNNPLALAHGLFTLDMRARKEPITQAPRIIYINPDALRGELRSTRRPPPGEDVSPGGLATLLEVAKGALPSARQYELQSMARALAGGSGDSKSRPFISTTDRAYPIVSEHLGAFAGFFGKPFREYDFYAGAYDAMHYVAEHILCAPPRLQMIGTQPESLDSCRRRELVHLIANSDWFSGSVVARGAYEAFFRAEFRASTGLAALPATRTESDKLYVHRQLVLANADEFELHADCAGGDVVDRALCVDGFVGMVDRFATDSIVRLVATWSGDPVCRLEILTLRRGCNADGTFLELVDNGARAFATARLNDIFRQIHEDRLQKSMTKSIVGGGEFLFRSIDDAHQPRLLLDPSTVTPYASRRWHTYPYRVTGLLGGSGASGIEASYLPSVRLSPNLRIIAPLGIAYARIPALTADGPYHAVLETGLGVSVHPGIPKIHTLELDWRVLSATGVANPRIRDRIGYRVLWQPLGGKLSFGYGQLPAAFVPPGGSRNLFSLGVGDVNGMLYYWLRK